MRIGVVPVQSYDGGIYQNSLNVLYALESLKNKELQDEFILFVFDTNHPIIETLKKRGWEIKSIYPNTPSKNQRKLQLLKFLRRLIGEGPHREAWRKLKNKLQQKKPKDLPDPDRPKFNNQMHEYLRECRIDIMFYIAHNNISFESRIPYIAFVADIQHRLQPHFTEVSSNGIWEQREYFFRNVIRYATLIIVDSEVGKEDILRFYGTYGATPNLIKVLPYIPPYYIFSNLSYVEEEKIRKKYKLPEKYLFYPAQFWPHKNHTNIIQALERIKRIYGIEIPIVFCGSHNGDVREKYFQLVMNMARYCGVANQVHYLGYIPNEDMSAIYGGATALVMPTFFGPANIPYLEAWAKGCPVLTSNIRGIREQVGDAGILVNPNSVEEIADGIYRLWKDENLRKVLIERGKERLNLFNFDNYSNILKEILEEAKNSISKLR